MWIGRTYIVLIFIIAFMFMGSMAHAAPGNQTKCPVMGFDISRDLFTDYQSKRVYFCCSSCPGDFKKTPDFYMDQMRDSGVILEDVPA